MSFERRTTAAEFETMLRRHLRGGGSPVSACAGFDPDRASAYLEGALGGQARGRYEAHLAGCPECRRHIIELSRLARLAVQPEIQQPENPRPELMPPPAVAAPGLRWQSSIAAGIGHLVLNWRLAGAVLATCAVLVTFLIVRPIRRSPQMRYTASLRKAENQAPSVQVQAVQQRRESEKKAEVDSNNSGAAMVESARASRQGQPSKHPIPEPRISPPALVSTNLWQKDPLSDVDGINGKMLTKIEPDEHLPSVGHFDEATKVTALKAERVAHSPADTAEPPPSEAARKKGPQAAAANETSEFIPTTRRIESESGDKAENGRGRSGTQSGQITFPLLLPRMKQNPEYNSMQTSSFTRAKTERGLLLNQKSSVISHVVDYMKGYVPWWRTDNFEKSLLSGALKDGGSKESKESVKDDSEKPNKLVRHLRGKTFRYIRGVWVDDKFDSEMSAWRITWLRKGSEQYNRVLTEEPQLADFFEFGPIIIVWQDKIYRVQTGK
ncbi:MAG: zf-HC2 domain-containing protein [Blastocatellia bacterium]|nr:zf-HC2 domain-containing protein [Blastocatellia bacterium]